ncbi:MAG: response regulator transcription factor [Candidatus Pacebacteria bacterium]|nr:response regulator transcription factor [Candidatus Paceibacterota bacterium]
MRILIIEGDKETADFIVRGLEAERFAADRAPTAVEGVAWAGTGGYDLVIVDANSGKGTNGPDVCAAIRKEGASLPVIVLSAANDTVSKVRALDLGADDCLAKPFVIAELLARIRALLRREKKLTGPKLTVADIVIDTRTHTATRAGRPLALNRKEFALLEYLMRNVGTALTRRMILEHVWDMNADPFTNTVDVHISFLRAKIDRGRRKKLIETVYGHGYKMGSK